MSGWENVSSDDEPMGGSMGEAAWAGLSSASSGGDDAAGAWAGVSSDSEDVVESPPLPPPCGEPEGEGVVEDWQEAPGPWELFQSTDEHGHNMPRVALPRKLSKQFVRSLFKQVT